VEEIAHAVNENNRGVPESNLPEKVPPGTIEPSSVISAAPDGAEKYNSTFFPTTEVMGYFRMLPDGSK